MLSGFSVLGSLSGTVGVCVTLDNDCIDELALDVSVAGVREFNSRMKLKAFVVDRFGVILLLERSLLVQPDSDQVLA